jgi:hypothetical protein
MHGDILKFREPDSFSLLLKLQILIAKKISTTSGIFSLFITGSRQVLVLFSYPMATVCSTHTFFAFLLLQFQKKWWVRRVDITGHSIPSCRPFNAHTKGYLV